jgi:hypothetical protein
MDGITDEHRASRGFARSALALATCIVVVALLFIPFAMRQSGSAGLFGLGAAAAILLMSGLAAEGLATVFARLGTPLAALVIGMIARMTPALVICLVLALQGTHGRRHLAFICYLLAFYLATLALETWLAVKRVNHTPSDLTHTAG